MAYKRKFANRREAYDYLQQRILTVKDPKAIVAAYNAGISKLPTSIPKRTEHVAQGITFHAFDVSVGTAPYDEIIIDVDGGISI